VPPPSDADRIGHGPTIRSRGQSLVEFALVLPVFVVLFATALDLGRVFYAQISLANAAREAAFQAAETPTSFQPNTDCPAAPADPSNNLVMCRALLEADGSFVEVRPADVSLSCSPSCTVAQGHTVTVRVQGPFQLVTPILTPFFGGSQTITLRSTATAAMFAIPTRPPMAAPSGAPQCTVPDLVGLRASDADILWSAEGFSGLLTRSGSGDFIVVAQSPAAGTVLACTSGGTVWESGALPATPSPTPAPTAAPTTTPDPGATPPPGPTPTPTPSPSPAPECFTPTGLAGVYPPNVIGLTPSVASSRITAKGLNPIQRDGLTTGQKGVVQEQNPDETVCVEKGSDVVFHYRRS
jgi:hypothetical protein